MTTALLVGDMNFPGHKVNCKAQPSYSLRDVSLNLLVELSPFCGALVPAIVACGPKAVMVQLRYRKEFSLPRQAMQFAR